MSSWTGSTVCVICEKTQVMIPGNRTCDAFDCRREYQEWLRLRKPVCAVCGVPLDMFTGTGETCGGQDCQMRWVGLTRAGDGISLARCSFCGVFSIKRSNGECVCRDHCCGMNQALARRIENQRIEAEKFQDLVRTAESLRDNLSAENPNGKTEKHLVAMVPHTSAPMAEPNPEAVASFEKKLRELVHAAINEPEKDADWPRRPENLPDLATEKELPVFIQGCTSCRGHCCRQGEDHAFLSVGIMRRYTNQHPEKTADEVVNDYLQYLPAQSIEDSCVFHTDHGCNMPREMRSDMCNQFICYYLGEIRTSIEKGAPGFFVVSEKDGTFFDTRFVDVPGDQE